MRHNLLHFSITIVLAFLFALFLPWWSVMLAAIGAAFLVPLKKATVFFIPFLGIFLLWFLWSYYLSASNNFIMAKRIAVLLPLEGNPYLLMVVTGIIGGLAAGIAGIFGTQLRRLIKE
ncbi:hypothetical protein [Winogradskyella arenosi]|uniref:Uncharacterized protein n=1 Tax=Winogradskyella arenosi TaxID=533325 RepID=A0A368ZKX2_9FLAO|nr:hypothetical protein [Winogradskyella arenosi]RCW92265.1 hypothetical protein DFQ08_102288 [Winogradskyella arenosi]